MLRTTTFRKVMLIGLLTFLILSQADSVSAGINVWTYIGPHIYSTIIDLVIDPKTPSTLYTVERTGDVFKSTNGGGDWSPANNGLSIGLNKASVITLEIDPKTPTTLYSVTSLGVFKSTNGGEDWSPVNNGLPFGDIFTSLAIDPVTPSTLYVGTWFHGVFKSTNGGGTWGAVNAFLPDDTIVTSLAIDPQTPSTLYLVGSGVVFKSTSGGEWWSPANNGLTDPYISTLAMDPLTPSTIYAGTTGQGVLYESGGVFKSTDGGGIWREVSNGLTPLGNNQVFSLAIDPITPSTLYAGTVYDCVFESTNGGETWSEFNTGLPGLPEIMGYSVAIDPITPSTLYVGTWSAGVFAIQQIKIPALAINYSGGAPGSYFTISGSNYPPSSTATITINENDLGTVMTNSSGGFIFLLETSLTTEEGFYSVTVSVNPSASTQFTLDTDDDVRPQEGSETVFVVPDGIAYQVVYLPLIVR